MPASSEGMNRLWRSPPTERCPTARRSRQRPARTWLNVTSITLSKRSQREKDCMLHVLIDLKCSDRENAPPPWKSGSRSRTQVAGNDWMRAGNDWMRAGKGLLFSFFIWVLVMWGGQLGTFIKFMACVLFCMYVIFH